MEKSLQLPCFLLQLFFLNASCFMRQMVVQFTFTSFESSLFFSHELKIESVSSARPFQHVAGRSFCGHAFFFRFQICVISLLFFFSLCKVGDGIRSCALRVSRQLLTPKTTVSWHLNYILLCFEIINFKI